MAVTNSGMTLLIDNDDDTGWTGEDGTSTEVFWQGTGSQSWVVAKTATETATLTLSADLSAAKYFTFGFLSTIAPFYNTIKIQMQQDASNYEEFLLADRTTTALTYRAINGVFILGSPVMQFGEGTTTGTYSRASHTALAITVDNSTSGNIRSVENHYIDAMYYGDGRSIGGTTVGDKLFTESDALNISGDVLDCCTMIVVGGKTVLAMTDLYITTTTGNSYGESLEFRELPNTNNVYTLTITGTADFQASSYSTSSSNVTLNLDVSGATSFQMLGGSLVGVGTTLLKASQVIDSVVFTNRTSITHSASLFENNIINTSGVVTVSSTGTCTNNTFNLASGVSAILCADLSHAPDNTFISDGSSHAVELSTIGTGSMDWTCSTTDYDSGTTGSPVTPTSTGNESIYINVVTSSDLTINVSDTATIPSIRVGASFTGSINVVAGAITLKMIVKDKDQNEIVGAYAYIDDNNITPFILNTTTDVNGEASISHSTGAITGSTWRVRKYGYKPFVQIVDIGGIDITIPVTLIVDPQQT